MTDFVISISYGNYLIQNGGTDKVIREHRDMFMEKGINYLFLFPVIRTIKIGNMNKTLRYWGIDYDSNFIGIYKINGVLSQIDKLLQKNGRCIGLFIHHIWRVDINELKAILDHIKVQIYFYLHDFHCICSTKNFIREDGTFCGYGLDGDVCDKNCSFYQESLKNRKTFVDILSNYKERLLCIGPSKNTRKTYADTFIKYSDNFMEISHQKVDGEYHYSQKEDTLRVAFIGAQVPIKGWEDYKILLNEVSNYSQVKYYYLGSGKEHLANVEAAEVSVREQGPNAMMNTLRDLSIDVVLLLSRWPETYSYTYFESYAAGSFVITYRCSGNMTDMVLKHKSGFVVDDINDVIKLFEDSDVLIKRVREYQKNAKHIPKRLLPNHEIVDLTIKNAPKKNEMIVSNSSARKCFIPDLIYRAQNRSRLNESKSFI